MNEVKRLIESRQVEASKKQLTMKLMCIAKNLGQDIYGDFGFGSGFASNPADQLWDAEPEKDENGLQTVDEESDYSHLGKIYDDLRGGHNLEIRHMTNERQLRVKYNGYVVYLEEEGKLKSYVPHAVWETVIESLYAKARPQDDARKEKEKEEERQGYMKQASKFLKELRDAWGF